MSAIAKTIKILEIFYLGKRGAAWTLADMTSERRREEVCASELLLLWISELLCDIGSCGHPLTPERFMFAIIEA